MMRKKAMSVFVSFLLIILFSISTLAISEADAKNELQQTKAEMNALSKEKNKAKQTLVNDRKVRERIIAELEEKGYIKKEIEDRIIEIESALKTLENAIIQTQREYDEQLKLFQERLVAIYVQSKTNAVVDEILHTTDFTELFRTSHMLRVISQYDQDLMTSLEKKQLEIDSLKLQKQREEEYAYQQLEDSLKKIDQLEVSRSAAQERVAKSQATLAQLEEEEDQLEKEALELGELINKIGSKDPYSGGAMQWPTPGYSGISSLFGNRVHPILKYKKFHGGLDISAPYNAYIHAAASGTVVWSGWRQGGSGNTVIIDHGGGISTFYLHIKNGGLLVKTGQTVKAGDVIARVGSTGLSTGPHCHFEVRKDGVRQNPLNYVSRAR